MKANAAASNTTTVTTNVHRPPSYQKVKDGRKQPMRGLWQRGERFYARLAIEDDVGQKQVRWIPLKNDETKEPVRTVAEAKAALERLRVWRRDNTLPVLKRTPKFKDYVKTYLDHFEQVKDAKRPATVQKEKGSLNRWVEHMGEIRIDKINRAHINAFIAKRQTEGMSGRTVNLDVIALRNVLKRAIDDGWLKSLPTANLRPLKWTAKTRRLISMAEIDKLCSVATNPLEKEYKPEKGDTLPKGYKFENGQQLADYHRLMAYCGSRRCETLRLRWSDVDFDKKQLTIGSNGLTKNWEKRVVDFNPKLEAHLREMHARRAPDSKFLFPSPQRGDKDQSAKTFMETLKLVRAVAGIKDFTFHLCRHFFISFSVMNGIDFMTIASWVGHRDGGVLIGKVYGHLADAHKKQQAQKLAFEPVVLEGMAR